MVSKSYLLCLALILMSVATSARRPPVIEKIEASEPAPVSLGAGGKAEYVSHSINDAASIPVPSPTIYYGISEASQTDVSRIINGEASILVPSQTIYNGGDKKKNGEASQTDVSQSINDEACILVPSPTSYNGGDKKKNGEASQTDVSRSINVEASIPLPSPLSLGRGGRLKIVGDEIQDSVAIGLINNKIEGRNGRSNSQPGSLAVGLIPIIPGGDGSFHFNLGPIDLGGNIGWGGFTPGYVYNQPQPYVVVSPYTSQYPIPSPYALANSGYGQGQPSQGYYGPYPYARGYGPGSSQAGSSAFNQHN